MLRIIELVPDDFITKNEQNVSIVIHKAKDTGRWVVHGHVMHSVACHIVPGTIRLFLYRNNSPAQNFIF